MPSPRSAGSLLVITRPALRRRTSSSTPAIRVDWRYVVLICLCLYLVVISTAVMTLERTTVDGAPLVQATLPVYKNKNITSSSSSSSSEEQITIPRLQPHELKLPTPVIVMGLMKAGTTSIYGYFKCGLVEHTPLSHYDCKPGLDPTKIVMACGKRMRRNLTKMNKPAFDTMDHFVLYAELDAQELNGGMTLPQWEFIDGIYEQFPNATWILNWREPTQWLSSVNRWKDLRQRFVDNPYPPELPRGKGEDDEDMLHFYARQAERVREFARQHPSLSFVELPIDSPQAGEILEQSFGISRQCWRTRNVNRGEAVWTPV